MIFAQDFLFNLTHKYWMVFNIFQVGYSLYHFIFILYFSFQIIIIYPQQFNLVYYPYYHFLELLYLDLRSIIFSFFNEENRFIKSFANVIKEELDLLPAYITSGGTSDARFIIKHCPVMEFGALYKLAHQVNESISIDDIQSLYKIYHNFLHDVL